jgi:UDP-N-acetylmuramate--alanine ligase
VALLDHKRIHFIGIGGSGVSGLAEIAYLQGYSVTGSDASSNANTDRLAHLGIALSTEHDASHIQNTDAVVYSTAIKENNVELKAAREANLPCMRRGEFLAELFNLKYGIAVAGTHGKTTTSSLISHTLLYVGLNPTFVIGGVLKEVGSSAYLGDRDYFVAESDESDGSFLWLKPKVAIVTNIDRDHLENYQGDFNELKKAFLKFIHNVVVDGLVILCLDDPIVAELIPEIKRPYVTYGFSEKADYCARDFLPNGLKTQFSVTHAGKTRSINLTLPGVHNVLNAMAVIALADYLKVPEGKIEEALGSFKGVGRRFQFHGEYPVHAGLAQVYEDYGHHPNEVKATIQAAKDAWPQARVVVVFQPHRYTRTRDLMQEFVQVLLRADVLVLLDIYPAGEPEIPGINSEVLLNLINQYNKVPAKLIQVLDNLNSELNDLLQAGDIVLFQGAGSIGQMAKKFISHSG